MIHIVEDDPYQRRALAVICEHAGYAVETYRSGEEFLDSYSDTEEGCILLDLNLGDLTGAQVHAELARRKFTAPVIICTGEASVHSAIEHLKLGAADYLVKPITSAAVIAAIERVRHRRGEVPSAPGDDSHVPERLRSLTPRELEIASHVAAGQSTKQIAALLGLSEKTVANHRQRILDKTGAPNTAALVRLVMTSRRDNDLGRKT